MSNGWIKLHRRIVNWEWYKEPNTLALFLHLLIKANHKDGSWKGMDIKRGQLVTGRKVLSSETGLSEQQVRTSLKHLNSTQEIVLQPTNKNTLITLVNYNSYQEKEQSQPADPQPDNQQSTSNQPATNHKQELKNLKKVIKPPSVRFTPDHMKFAEGMYLSILKVAPRTPKPDFNKWADDIRILNESRKIDIHEMADVFRWANQDHFWKTNIKSAGKFKKQYAELHSKMLNQTDQSITRTTQSNIEAAKSFLEDQDDD